MVNEKIISISMVKNEEDIIEFFIRYNLNFIDEMYIIEHMSNDRTLDILKDLKSEGLPIHIIKYSSYAYNQGDILTKVLNKIRVEKDIKFVIFIDADENITGVTKERFNEILASKKCNSFYLYDKDYLIAENEEDENLYSYEKVKYEPNNFGRRKSIINLSAFKNRKINVEEGGHDFSIEGKALKRQKSLSEVYLAHLPYRSNEQMIAKIVIGCLGYMIRSGNMSVYGFGGHWFKIYSEFIQTGDINVFKIPKADKYLYRKSPLKLDAELKYTKINNLNSLEILINFIVSYIEYNGDLEKRESFLDFIENTKKLSKRDRLLEIIKEAEAYILSKGNTSFDEEKLIY